MSSHDFRDRWLLRAESIPRYRERIATISAIPRLNAFLLPYLATYSKNNIVRENDTHEFLSAHRAHSKHVVLLAWVEVTYAEEIEERGVNSRISVSNAEKIIESCVKKNCRDVVHREAA